MTDRTKNVLAKIMSFVAAILWGSSFFVVKNTVDSIPPAYLLAMRFTIGTVVLTVIFHKRLKGVTVRGIRRGVIIGVILFLASYVQTLGLAGTTPGKNAFLTSVYCVIVPFLYWAVRRKRPAMKAFLSAAICLTGVGLVSLSDGFTIELGDLLTLLSGFFFACHIVSIAVLGRETDPIALTIIQFMTMMVLSWTTGFCFETFPTELSREAIISVAYLALFPSTVGFLSQTVAQKYASPESTALIFSLESVFGVFFSVLFYGEELTPRGAAGLLTIFLAVLLSEINFKRFFRKKEERGIDHSA